MVAFFLVFCEVIPFNNATSLMLNPKYLLFCKYRAIFIEKFCSLYEKRDFVLFGRVFYFLSVRMYWFKYSNGL